MSSMRWIIFSLGLLASSLHAVPPSPVEFVAIIASYNNERWCIKNLKSIVSQSYPHLKIIYVNDCSTDRTGARVAAYIKKHKLENRCQLINNSIRKGALQNFYETIHRLEPHKVVAMIDGDDRLAHSRVFEKLAKVYGKGHVWVTSGNYTTEPYTGSSYCEGYSEEVIQAREFRACALWQGCQLRTYYAGLFQKINTCDLMYGNSFLPMSGDFAVMFPLFEMAAKGHIAFIKEPIYVVNTANPISDIKKNAELQRFLCGYVRGLPRYEALDTLP